jgi:ketosteroid isomerase-like protein
MLPAILLVFALQTQAQRSTQADPQTLAFLQQFREDYASARQTGQPEKLSAYFADSVRLMPEFQQTIWTKANATQYYRAFGQRFKVLQFKSDVLEVMDLGRMVVEFGTFTEILQQSANGKTDTVQGKYANIWQRGPQPKPRLIAQAWNYSHPVQLADQLVFREVPAVNMAFRAHVYVNDPLSFELAAYNALQERVVAEHDPVRWNQFYTDDFLFFYSNHPAYKGRAAITAFLDDHVKHLPVFEKLDIRTDRIDDLDGFVIEYASHTAIVRHGNWSGVATGKNIYIWRRERNGILKICRGVAMYDAGL